MEPRLLGDEGRGGTRGGERRKREGVEGEEGREERIKGKEGMRREPSHFKMP